MDLVAERVGHNQSLFREANERIEDAAAGHVDAPPFICECANPTCTAMIRLTIAEYEHVRADDRRFFTAPGHEAAAMPWARVLEEHERYVVSEKTGAAAAAAEERSRRNGDDAP